MKEEMLAAITATTMPVAPSQRETAATPPGLVAKARSATTLFSSSGGAGRALSGQQAAAEARTLLGKGSTWGWPILGVRDSEGAEKHIWASAERAALSAYHEAHATLVQIRTASSRQTRKGGREGGATGGSDASSVANEVKKQVEAVMKKAGKGKGSGKEGNDAA